ncbi:hypothetical protein [Priestia aryabhattai]
MSDLFQLYSLVYDHNQKALIEIKKIDHPLIQILRKSLIEQENVLKELLPKLNPTSLLINDIKEPITILYHNYDIVHSIFRAYERAVKWTETGNLSTANYLNKLLPEMKLSLEKVGDTLETMFGFETIKYVVPSFYLNKVR